MAFEVVDVDVRDPRSWGAALAPHREAALRLLDGFDGQCESAVGALRGRLGLRAFALARSALTTALAARGGPRVAEVRALADRLGVPPRRLLFANLAYDVAAAAPVGLVPPPGCSTFVAASDGSGPLHARNLDWHFPGTLLREHPLVVRACGAPAGEWTAVSWPGLTGVLTAVAPGRFSVSVNFVKLRGHGFGHLLSRAAAGALPVPWAVRAALDGARDFDAAVGLLGRAPLLAPVLFTVAGVRRGEACVLERAPSRAALRRCAVDAAHGAVCVTNHYASDALRGRSVDYDAGDTLVRLRTVEEQLARAGAEPVQALAALAILAPAVRGHTQHQVVMRAADGLLTACVPGGEPRAISAA